MMSLGKLELRMLEGDLLQLEPLEEKHQEGLKDAANHEEIWQYMPLKGNGEHFHGWFTRSLEQMRTSEEITYVVRSKNDHRILGATAYYDIYFSHQRLSLGYTWYTPEVWGSGVNRECKLIMLQQAFADWGINRVELGADPRNIRSVQAIRKLGAEKEGLLRQHMRSQEGMLTDTLVFSILAQEWPGIKMKLEVVEIK
jgi:RimJ/RimL family protein N-acetyltransferase